MTLKWLLPPKTDDKSRGFAYRALHYTLILLILISIRIILIGGSVVHSVITPIFLSVYVISYILLQRQQLQVAAALFLSSFWILLTASMYSLNGLNNASYYMYVVVIIFANILYTRRRVVIFVTVISSISGVILYLGHDAGILPVQTSVSPYVFDRMLIGVILFASAGILLSSAAHTLRSSLEQVQHSEHQLQARNQELQALTERLRISEERYRILFENSGVIAVVYDEKDTIVLANEPAATSVERTPETMVGMSIADIFGDTADMVSQKHREALQKNDMILFEGILNLPSGYSMEYLRHVIPLPQSSDAEDEQQILVLTTDITERKQAEQRERELEFAQEKLKFFTDFFGTVSHDIKTPLSTMNTSLHLLERSTDNPDHHRRIERLKNQVKLIQAYIQNMLMIAKLEHIPELSVAGVKLAYLVATAVDVNQPLIEQKKLNCAVSIPDSFMVEVDHEQFQRVMLNLIENAINYTPEGGTIQINASQQDNLARIEVTDSGIGIPEDDLAHIFDAFYRSREAKARLSSGTGLGLAIVKRIINLHRGDIRVSSAVGEGTTFRIELPA